jgi:hypothetical protein
VKPARQTASPLSRFMAQFHTPTCFVFQFLSIRLSNGPSERKTNSSAVATAAVSGERGYRLHCTVRVEDMAPGGGG